MNSNEKGGGEEWAPRDAGRIWEALGAIAIAAIIFGALYLSFHSQ